MLAAWQATTLYCTTFAALACSGSPAKTQSPPDPIASVDDATPESPGPLLWRLDAKGVAPSFLLAAGQDVKADQLPTAVWEKFKEADHVILEMNLEGFGAWLMARPPALKESLDEEEFQDFLLAQPGLAEDALARVPPGLAMAMVSAPDTLFGQDVYEAVAERAKVQRKNISYLVEDIEAYLDSLLPVLSAVGPLRDVLRSPKKERARRTQRRLAYLRGDAESLASETYLSAEHIAALEAHHSLWIQKIVSAAQEGGAFVVILESDLLSENGVLARLQKEASLGLHRAMPKTPPSNDLPARVHMSYDDCEVAVRHMLDIRYPETADTRQGSKNMRKVFLTQDGRGQLYVCTIQTQAWLDCIFAGETGDDFGQCDRDHPAAF